MQELGGKVAVVTGAASGIGRGMADRFAAEGMRVVLADVEADALATAEKELAATGAEVLAVPTDVADRDAVLSLADAATDRFGTVHVLCNNAGVSGGGGALWETTDRDWDWVLGVNLMGVVHGIQAFVPAMVAHGEPGHIVNTSSVLGLSSGGGSIYSVTKHAVTRLSEGLLHDLRAAGSPIGVSALYPGMIATHIVSADRNRPAKLRNDAEPSEEAQRLWAAMQERFLADGMPPSEVAAMVVDAIHTDRFYVLTHPEMIKPLVEARMTAILGDADPPEAQMMQMMGRRPQGGSS
jgi:NAD(P)-dependent dehydrogenase (short-subunit alcohol dehydrogenase family)